MAIEHVGNVQFAPGKGITGNLKENVRIIDISPGASAGSTYHCLRFPSNTIIMGESTFIANGTNSFSSVQDYTLVAGLFGVDGNIVDDDDVLASVTRAFGGSAYFEVSLIPDPTNYGKQLWQFIDGLTKDPGGEIDMKVTLKTDVDVGGRLNVMIIYKVY